MELLTTPSMCDLIRGPFHSGSKEKSWNGIIPFRASMEYGIPWNGFQRRGKSGMEWNGIWNIPCGMDL